jgi:hypothetical protein
MIFDAVYCIHLPDAERRTRMEAEFARAGVSDVTYVHARQPASGFTLPNMRRNPRLEFAVNLSHIAAVVQAMHDRAETPLFVEDDITIDVERMTAAVADLPEWDVCYFGGHPRGPATRVTSNLARVGRFSCAESYSVRGHLLNDLHRLWCDRIGQPDAMFDFILSAFAETHRAFCAYPVATRQGLSSHLKGGPDDKRALIDRGWQTNLAA